ncbi:MAG: hypothetical protein B7733_08845, partial [Myxococcales bacterium FL481]
MIRHISARATICACVWWSVSLAAVTCTREPRRQDAAIGPTSPAPAQSRLERRSAAHQAAAERFFTAAQQLAEVDGWSTPLPAEPLRVPPLGAHHHSQLRTAYISAERERHGLDPGPLPRPFRVRVTAYDHLLRRVRSRLDGTLPERDDATWYVRRLQPWLGIVAERSAEGAGDSSAAFVRELAATIERVPAELGAADPEHLAAAAAEFRRFSATLGRLGHATTSTDLQFSVTKLREAVEHTATQLVRLTDAVAAAAPISRARARQLDPKPVPRRLDGPLGRDEFRRRVRLRLGLAEDPARLMARAQRAVLRYEAMREQLGEPPTPPRHSPATDCARTWQRVAEWASARPDDLVADRDCAPLLRYR